MNNSITWRAFYNLSEIFIAPLNIIWFIFAAAITYQNFHSVDLINIILCCLDVFMFDLAVNIADDYFDYKNGKDEHFLTVTNTIGRMQLSLPKVRNLMIFMYIISAVPGIFLVMRTGWQVLLLGAIGYFIGIFYTAGPKPLNATGFCELIVSTMISIFIVEVGVYIGSFGQFSFTWPVFWTTLAKCLPITFLFFATQLANNTCDLREDLINGRKTLASYLGTKRSLKLLKILTILGYVTPLFLMIFDQISWVVALVVLLTPFLWKNLQIFFNNPDKQKTYMIFIKNESLFFTIYIGLFAIMSILERQRGIL